MLQILRGLALSVLIGSLSDLLQIRSLPLMFEPQENSGSNQESRSRSYRNYEQFLSNGHESYLADGKSGWSQHVDKRSITPSSHRERARSSRSLSPATLAQSRSARNASTSCRKS